MYVEDCLDGMMFGHAHSDALVNYHNLAVDDATSVREIAEWTIEAMGIERRSIEVQYGEGSRGWRGMSRTSAWPPPG
ncbi:MAG: hypothetical protein ABI837_09315 [Acidobacteriota bacterium]